MIEQRAREIHGTHRREQLVTPLRRRPVRVMRRSPRRGLASGTSRWAPVTTDHAPQATR